MLKKIDDVTIIKYPELEKTGMVKHGFSTRLGGVSRGIWESMNLSFSRGDDPEAVMENFKRFSRAVGVSYERLVFSQQTHTTNVLVVDEHFCGEGIVKPQKIHDIDGLVTNCKDVPLTIFAADCVPLFFVDPVKGVIGASHSGWRGTVGMIGLETVKVMTSQFGSRPEDIIAAIGPSVCQECYEVSQDVADAFYAAFEKDECEDMIIDKGCGKYQLDLWKANKYVMIKAGILPEHISLPEICTCHEHHMMWSHRAQGLERGSLAGILCLA